MNRPRPWPSREACLEALRDGDGRGIAVAVLDTGVDPRHPDFSDLHFSGAWDVRIDGGAPRVIPAEALDPVGHGTAIAGIIHRMAPAAEILSIRVLGGDQRQHRHELIRRGDPAHPVPLRTSGSAFRVPAPGGGHSTVSGSSFAAAHATGMLARMLSRFPGLSPSFAREALLHLAEEPYDIVND